MKHSELRKGNIVRYQPSGVLGQVEEIRIDEQMSGLYPVVYLKLDIGTNVLTDLSFLDPVKLDKEWLYALGFSEKKPYPSGAGYALLDNNGFRVNIGDNKYILTPSEQKKEGYCVEYVHDLQNLYYYLSDRKECPINSLPPKESPLPPAPEDLAELIVNVRAMLEAMDNYENNGNKSVPCGELSNEELHILTEQFITMEEYKTKVNELVGRKTKEDESTSSM